MTIFTKKKTQQKNEESSEGSSHHSHNPAHHPHQLGIAPPTAENCDLLFGGPGSASPPRWSLPSTSRDPALQQEPSSVGPTLNKRRHRASPHNFRPKHRERERDKERDRNRERERLPGSGPASPVASSNQEVGSSSPIAGPSGLRSVQPEEYNSGDEYQEMTGLTEEEWEERERYFEKKMRKKGLIIKRMNEDGACLFRSVADQVYGDQEMHHTVRKECMDYVAKNADYFSQYVTEDFASYVQRKRTSHVHGNHIEIQAMCELYNRNIEVYCYRSEPINTFHSMYKTDNASIRVSYHKGTHYNSIVDPYKATIGVGLGLPGLVPGQADKNQMKDALSKSEDFHIEQTMLEDKMKATDWEATNEVIEEQVARESYLQWLRDNEKRALSLQRSSTVTSASLNESQGGGSEPLTRSSPPRQYTPPHCSNAEPPKPKETGPAEFNVLETASFMNQLPPDMFGLAEWEDPDILAQVLAASQQEYLDSLKKATRKEETATS